MIQLNQNTAALSHAIRMGEKMTGPEGIEYFEPPVTGENLIDNLPLWRQLSEQIGLPVAKVIEDGRFFVVGPQTTEPQFQKILAANTTEAGFKEHLLIAAAYFE